MSILPKPEDVDGYVSGFERFLKVTKANLGIFLILVVLGSAIGAGYMFRTEVQQMLRPSPKVEAERLYAGGAKDMIMDKAVGEARKELGCARLLIWELHNNTHGLSGIPWGFATARYWGLKPGVDINTGNVKDVTSTLWWEVILGTMPEKGGVFGFAKNVADMESNMFKGYASSAGAETIYAYGIRDNVSQTPIGFVVCSFLDAAAPKISPEEAFKVMSALAKDYQILIDG